MVTDQTEQDFSQCHLIKKVISWKQRYFHQYKCPVGITIQLHDFRSMFLLSMFVRACSRVCVCVCRLINNGTPPSLEICGVSCVTVFQNVVKLLLLHRRAKNKQIRTTRLILLARYGGIQGHSLTYFGTFKCDCGNKVWDGKKLATV